MASRSSSQGNQPLLQTRISEYSNSALVQRPLDQIKPIDISYNTIQLKKDDAGTFPIGFSMTKHNREKPIKKNTLLRELQKKSQKAALDNNNSIKLAICITMYNEEEDELKRTMRGILEGYQKLLSDKQLNFQQDNMVVCLVCDGYDRISKDFLKYAARYKLFDLKNLKQKGFLKKNPGDRTDFLIKDLDQLIDLQTEELPQFNNLLHLFQVRTWDFGIDRPPHQMRVNFLMGIKHRNDGKINSHRWFYQGICKFLEPSYCLMLDVGTRPAGDSIYKLYKHIISHPHCGGCCGQIQVDFSDQRGITSTFWIKSAQFFEYKMAHTPDKSCESVFGFQSVLPGAYSLFRWSAIEGKPLDEFYRGVEKKSDLTCSEANKYLAEDRIMCLEIMIKKDSRFILEYVVDAKAFTDVPPTLSVLIKQRRRWINGSLFGTYHVISHFFSLISCKEKHNKCRQCCLCPFLIYYTLTFLFQFFLIGGLYAATTTFITNELSRSLRNSGNNGGFLGSLIDSLDTIFSYAYLVMMFLCIMVSLSEPISHGICKFRCLVVLLGIVGYFMFVGLIYTLFENGYKEQDSPDQDSGSGSLGVGINLLAIGVTISLASFLIPIVLRPIDFCSNIIKYVVGFIVYLFMFPTFATVIQIYAMSNLHDISWGNRPTAVSQGVEAVAYDKQKQEKLKVEYQTFRSTFLYIWVILNGLYGLLISNLVSGKIGQSSSWSSWFLIGFSLFVSLLVVFKTIAAILFVIGWQFKICCQCCKKKKTYQNIRQTQVSVEQLEARQTRFNRYTQFQNRVTRESKLNRDIQRQNIEEINRKWEEDQSQRIFNNNLMNSGGGNLERPSLQNRQSLQNRSSLQNRQSQFNRQTKRYTLGQRYQEVDQIIESSDEGSDQDVQEELYKRKQSTKEFEDRVSYQIE